jgi:hypothetical protein
MRIDPKIRYKSETGYSAFMSIEASLLTEQIDSRMFEFDTKSEIIDTLRYNEKHGTKWGVFIESLPAEYVDGSDIFDMITPEYIKWLEDELEKLT